MTKSNLKILALTAIILSLGAVSGHAQQAPSVTPESKMVNPLKKLDELQKKVSAFEKKAKDAADKLGKVTKQAEGAAGSLKKIQGDLVTAGQNATDQTTKDALNKVSKELNDVTQVYSDMSKL